ncbi:MAG: hypothetical protein K0U12_03255 [Gammaproteobacteria bacterium]|nr:hypothetical protein [Gammaproteobacteria bacterium]
MPLEIYKKQLNELIDKYCASHKVPAKLAATVYLMRQTIKDNNTVVSLTYQIKLYCDKLDATVSGFFSSQHPLSELLAQVLTPYLPLLDLEQSYQNRKKLSQQIEQLNHELKNSQQQVEDLTQQMQNMQRELTQIDLPIALAPQKIQPATALASSNSITLSLQEYHALLVQLSQIGEQVLAGPELLSLSASESMQPH